MTLETASELTQTHHVFHAVVASFRQCRILHRACVPFGQNEFVSAFHSRIRRVYVHNFEIQRGHDVRRRKRSARMSRACFMYCFDNVDSNPGCDVLVFLKIHFRPPGMYDINLFEFREGAAADRFGWPPWSGLLGPPHASRKNLTLTF